MVPGIKTIVKAAIIHEKVAILKRKGVKINKHIVVFESDDWGSIRLPSLKVREHLLSLGISFQSPNSYDLFDTLASESDLSSLIEVLYSVKDSNGNPAIITLNTVVANPDFNRIKESGYKEYFYEPFTETLTRYPNHKHSFDLWKEGINNKVFQPQFHSREHLNAMKWLQLLQERDKDVIAAFNEGVFSMRCNINGKKQRILETYNAYSGNDYVFMKNAIHEGLDLFERLFGFRSSSMIAPCYTWDAPIEEASKLAGVKYLQGNVFQKHSSFYSLTHNSETSRIMGAYNDFGQIQLVRNCVFEPSQNPHYNKDRCLSDIAKQFKMNHPAIVSCHRLNFIGDLVLKNREHTLHQFKGLLDEIVRIWPDVVFMSSDKLGDYLDSNNK